MVKLKSTKEISILHAGGRKLARILEALGRAVRPGITTGELEAMAVAMIEEAGGRPAFLGYRSHPRAKPYPTALCASINDEIVHAPALPARILKTGDIIGLDLGLEYPASGGLYTDAALTVAVGRISKEAERLLRVTRESLAQAIRTVRPGARLSDIGRAVETVARQEGLAVVRDLVGHGVGYHPHEDPYVPNYVLKKDFDDIILKPGLVIAIEPMINLGTDEIVNAANGFTIKTADGQLSAHFEHTVAVTEDGCLVLTKV